MVELFKANGHTTLSASVNGTLEIRKPFAPMAQGFDYHYGMYSNLDPVKRSILEIRVSPILRTVKLLLSAPSELDESLHAGDPFFKRNKDNPFFLYLPHTMLHVPLGVSLHLMTPKMGRVWRCNSEPTTVSADSWIRSRDLVWTKRRLLSTVRITGVAPVEIKNNL